MLFKKNIWARSKTYLSENIYYDQNGFLVCENATLGRSGIYRYKGKQLGLATNDIVEVYREEEDVFNEESLKSLNLRPLTLDHPNVQVTIDNVKKYSKGEVYNVRREGDNIVGDIIVKDKYIADLIVNNKVRELSLGYTQDLYYNESTKLYNFKNIIYNHLALVKKGRAGNAMILDSQDEVLVLEEEIINDSTEEVKEQEVETKDEILEKTQEETEDSCVEDTKEEVVETNETTNDTNEEQEEEKVVEDSEEVKDKEPKVENKEELTQDSEEIIEEKGEQIVKDINYFLERQKEIANIKDENMKKKMSLILDSEMEQVLGKPETTQPDIVVKDGGEQVVVKTYEQEMQEYYDKFNPNNYESSKDAIDFYKKEANYRPKKY